MKKIIIFGLGAVSRVMTQCFYELFKNSSDEIQFVFICRDIVKSKENLFKMEHILNSSSFVEMKDFSQASENIDKYKDVFAEAIGVINCSVPYFNDDILKFASILGIHYCDLSSDMYNEETRKNQKFGQEKYDSEFKKKNMFALINAGISPGITNFLIGEKIIESNSNSTNKIQSINLHLFENIVSSEVIFSWSPKEAFNELEQKPDWFENDKLITIEPFTNEKSYIFPHFKDKIQQYPISQEEVFSLHQTYPHISTIRAYSGGSEVELVKNLFQLNLLSKNTPVCKDSDMSIEEIVTGALPGLRTSEKLGDLLRKGVIKSAQFASMVEIMKEDVVEVTGLSFNHYLDLLDSPYEGATYISYPAGIGAAIMFFYTYKLWTKDKKNTNGIIRGEQLPYKMGLEMSAMMKVTLVKYGIDFISHSHSFKFCKSDCYLS
jgi:saccharopine dehydrogenase-like NADP-dependent oxidoreductase